MRGIMVRLRELNVCTRPVYATILHRHGCPGIRPGLSCKLLRSIPARPELLWLAMAARLLRGLVSASLHSRLMHSSNCGLRLFLLLVLLLHALLLLLTARLLLLLRLCLPH